MKNSITKKGIFFLVLCTFNIVKTAELPTQAAAISHESDDGDSHHNIQMQFHDETDLQQITTETPSVIIVHQHNPLTALHITELPIATLPIATLPITVQRNTSSCDQKTCCAVSCCITVITSLLITAAVFIVLNLPSSPPKIIISIDLPKIPPIPPLSLPPIKLPPLTIPKDLKFVTLPHSTPAPKSPISM